jgi:hypothetical protein
VQYSPTHFGSSGSPVFDSAWKVVALHHSGGNAARAGHEAARVRERGIAIRTIIDDLRGLECCEDYETAAAIDRAERARSPLLHRGMVEEDRHECGHCTRHDQFSPASLINWHHIVNEALRRARSKVVAAAIEITRTRAGIAEAPGRARGMVETAQMSAEQLADRPIP